MTQYEQPPYGAGAPNYGWTEPPKVSGWAIASIICALIFCVPLVTPLLGIVFGLAGIASIKSSEGRRTGTGLAVTGILLSAIVLAGQFWVVNVVGRYVPAWAEMFTGFATAPSEFMLASEAGEVAEARTYLIGAVEQTVSDADFAQFRLTLADRVGEFRSWTMGDAVGDPQTGAMRISGDMAFDSGIFDATVIIAVKTAGPELKSWGIEEVIIYMPGEDDIVFPPEGALEAPVPAGPTEPDNDGATPSEESPAGDVGEGEGDGG